MDDWNFDAQENKKLASVLADGVELRPGNRVRLRPRKKGSDIFDIALRGMYATIAAIEQDLEDRIHVAVTVDDDPGRDLGMDGKIGHRFFFRPDEVEKIDDESVEESTES